MRTSSLLTLLVLLVVSACTGSPATLAIPPDFEVETSAGLAGVSIRAAPPGLTLSEYEQVVRTGMEAEMPASPTPDSAVARYPMRRIVWHVNPVPGRGVSRLVVNAFDGSVPFADKQELVDNSAPTASIRRAIRIMTRRLMTALDEQDQVARG